MLLLFGEEQAKLIILLAKKGSFLLLNMIALLVIDLMLLVCQATLSEILVCIANIFQQIIKYAD